jgi:hypothetical protein
MLSIFVLSILFFVVVSLVEIGLIPYCTNTELQRAPSLDGKWLAVAHQETCNSTFSGPFRAVIVRNVGEDRTQSEEQKIVLFEMGSLDDMLAVRWPEPETLEITVSQAITFFAKKETLYRGISIKYNVVTARPWSPP